MIVSLEVRIIETQQMLQSDDKVKATSILNLLRILIEDEEKELSDVDAARALNILTCVTVYERYLAKFLGW